MYLVDNYRGLWYVNYGRGERRQMKIESTVMKSNTFIGSGASPAVLIVQATFKTQPVRHGYTTRNEQEAAEVLFFLQETFCTETLKALAERLSVYK